MPRPPRLPSLRSQSPGLSLLSLLLLTFLSCSKTAGPFVAIKVTGLPAETTKLRITATYQGVPQTREIDIPAGTQSQEVPITLDFPADSFGSLKVMAEATDGSCALARKESSFELAENQFYDEGVVTLEPVPLAACSFKTFKLKVTVSDPTGGSLVSSVPGIDCGATCEANFRPDTPVTLNAKVSLGFDIVSWSEPSCGTSVSCPVTITADKLVTLTIARCTGWCEESPAAVTTDLNHVWAADVNTAYAVGASGVILKRESTGWVQMTSNTGQPLYGINGFMSALYAVGGTGTILSFEGGRWVKVGVPTAAMGESLRTTTIDQGGDVFVLGSKGTYLRRDVGAQNFVTEAAGNYGSKDILASDSKTGGLGAPAGNRAYVTADSRFFEVSCYLHRNEQNLNIGALNDVWYQDANTVYVVSATGAISRATRNGICVVDNWTAQTSTVTSALRSIHGTAANNIWIVGDGGVILKSTNGMTWTRETVPKAGTKQLNSVFAVGTDVYAVGTGGLILHYRP